MPKPKEKLRACDVLNWSYLVELATKYDPDIEKPTFFEGLCKLAYGLTQTGDESIRDQQLSEFLHDVTDHTSTDNAEELLAVLSRYLKIELKRLRQFAKENGIKLKRIKLW